MQHHSPRFDAASPVRSALSKRAKAHHAHSESAASLSSLADSASAKRAGVRWKEEIAEIKEVENVIVFMDAEESLDDLEAQAPRDDEMENGDEDSAAEEEDSAAEPAEEEDESKREGAAPPKPSTSTEEEEDEEEDEDEDEAEEEADAKQLAPVSDPEPLMAEIRNMRAVLEDESTDWTDRQRAMNRIEELVTGKDMASVPRFFDEMKLLKKALGTQLDDLRSSIVRDACNLLITLAGVLGHDERFAYTVKHCLPVLFRRLYVTIKVIAQSADECVRAVLSTAYYWAFKSIPEILKAAQTDPHAVVRARTVQYLTQVLNECPDDQFSAILAYEKPLAHLLKKNINDPDKKVRAATRQLFLAFANVWPQLAHRLYDKFPASVQRTITAELKRMMD
jgi:hypothetical protein